WPKAFNEMAWDLATDPDVRKRNGTRALELAVTVCQATRERQPEFVDTLAAAYAELGRFEDAVATARRAHALATKHAGLAEQVRERIKLYENRQPFRRRAKASDGQRSLDDSAIPRTAAHSQADPLPRSLKEYSS